MKFDIGKLRLGEQIAGVAAVLLLIDMFLSWYSVNVPASAQLLPGLDLSVNAWDAFSVDNLLMLLAIVVALAWVGMVATGTKVALPVAASVIALAVSALTLVVIFIRVVIDQPGPSNDLVNNEFGAYLGLLLLIAMVYGCYTAMATE